MALYFITYDLRNSKDYQTLYDELEKFNAVRIFESTWCFNRSNTSTSGLVNYFKQYVDKDDGILVSESSDWTTYNADAAPNSL